MFDLGHHPAPRCNVRQHAPCVVGIEPSLKKCAHVASLKFAPVPGLDRETAESLQTFVSERARDVYSEEQAHQPCSDTSGIGAARTIIERVVDDRPLRSAQPLIDVERDFQSRGTGIFAIKKTVIVALHCGNCWGTLPCNWYRSAARSTPETLKDAFQLVNDKASRRLAWRFLFTPQTPDLFNQKIDE